MSDTLNTPDVPAADNVEQQKKLNIESLSSEQLRALAEAWDQVQDSDTPMADLRTALSQNGSFEFNSKFNTNNIELRSMAVAAQGELNERQESDRKNELGTILSAVEGKTSYADKRTALSDLLGFGVVHGMNNLEIDRFIADAQAELDALNNPQQPDANDTPGDDGPEPKEGAAEDVEPAKPVPDLLIDHQEPVPTVEPPVENPPRPEDAEPPVVPPVEQRDQSLVLSFVDQTKDAHDAARDAAEARLRDELQQGGRFKRFITGLWKGENSLAGPYYREKYKREALAEIQRQNDILAHESDDLDARGRAQLATIRRFQSQYEESIHTEAGEKRSELDKNSESSRAIKDLIARYVSGEITDPAALEEERNRILQQLHESGHNDLIGEGKVRIDNLLAIANQVKAMADHGESVERVLEGMKIYSAEARSGVRSEAHLDKVSKLVERIQQKTYGLVNPETVAIGAAVLLGAFRAGRGTLLTAAGVTVVPGLLGGVLAGARENLRSKQERSLHAREMAQGKRYETGKQRDEVEATRYDTVSARESIGQLNELLASGEPTSAEIQSAYEKIALIEARIRMSDGQKMDLVSFSDPVLVEIERQELDDARALAKVRLETHIGKLPPAFRTQFNIRGGISVNQALEQYTTATTELVSDKDEKDKAFRKLRAKRVLKAAAVGGGTSLLFSLGTQEGLAFLNPSYDGLVEHMVQGGPPSPDGRQTLLEGLIHGKAAPSTHFVPHDLVGHKGALELPDNYKVVNNPDGTLTIEGANGNKVAENLTIDKHGSFTKESLATLEKSHVNVADTGFTKDVETTKTKDVSIKEYNRNHASDLHRVKFDFWYDNNTPKPKFEKNELGLDWGGNNNNGVGKDGGVQMKISGMTSNGSYHGNESIAWKEAVREGDIRFAVSGSRDTQHQVYFVKIKPDGSIDIGKDDPARKFFSVDKEGKMHFRGGYASPVEVRSEKGGVTHIAPLATITGENPLKHVEDMVPVKSKEHVPHFLLTPPAEAGREVEGIFVPGLVPRRPLERIAREVGGYGYNINGVGSEAEINKFTKERSPRLKANPEAVLEPKQELDWFIDELKSRRGAAYLEKLDDAIQRTPELQNMNGEVETIVTIPVAAAQEADTIYQTLSLYGQQEDESLSKSLILLNLNWLDTAAKDVYKQADIEKARKEIQRARKNFPKLKIAVFENEYNVEEVNRTGGVIGYVASDLMNMGLLAVQRRMQAGVMASDHDVLLVRNDADPEGLSRDYLGSYQRAFNDSKNQHVDVFKGVTRFGVEWAKKYPGFAIASNFAAGLSILLSSRGLPATGGANFAVKASTLAAVGGLGDIGWTGAGSDDGAVGRRIRTARYGIGVHSHSAIAEKKPYRIAAHVVGASVDTNPSRLIPYHIEGRPYQDAWGGDFAGGEGGYRERLAGKKLSPRGRSEIDGNWEREFKGIEAAISGELGWNGIDDSRRMLALFFGSVPGAYTVTEGEGGVKFKFTKAGREYIKDRIAHESNGAEGHYGDRLKRSVYGVRSPNGRQSVSSAPPMLKAVKNRIVF